MLLYNIKKSLKDLVEKYFPSTNFGKNQEENIYLNNHREGLFSNIYEKAKGFSIIELLVVISILGTLTAIAVPFYVGYRPRLILKQAAGQVRSDLMMNRQRAVTTSKDYYFKYDTTSASNTYEISIESSSSEQKTLPYRTKISRDPSNPLISPLEFNPSGMTNDNGGLIITHTSLPSDTLRLTVTRAGFVRIN